MDDQSDVIQLENQAIQAALDGNWDQAIDINQKIIEISPKNPSALNRLGTAYLKTSKVAQAKKIFKQVLKISPNNPIATKNLSNLKHLSPSNTTTHVKSGPRETISFIEEPGVSKIVPLIKPGSPQVIAGLEIGQNLTLKSSARRIKVFSEDKGEYIGRLPDNLSLNLSKLMKSGYKYQVLVKSTNPQSPQVFIKEIKRSKRLRDTPSFPANNNKKTIDISDGRPVNPPLQIFDPLAKEE